MIALLAVLILTVWSVEGCTKGCLKCDKETEMCLACDFENFFYLINGRCVEHRIKNCLFSSELNTCQVCQSGFYPQDMECSALDVARVVKNCLFYDEDQNCVICEPHHYFSDKKCLPSTVKVNNCIKYLKDATCSVCRNGHIDQTGKTCLSDDRNHKHCSLINHMFFCESCPDNINFIDYNLNGDDTTYNDYLELYKSVRLNTLVPSDLNLYKFIFKNCDRVEGGKCMKCDKGYFLGKDKECQKNPTWMLSHCKNYAEQDVCKVCKNGYRLNDDGKCVEVHIDHCYLYDHVTGICKQCKANYYLSSGLCVARRYIDENCEVYEKEQDSCKLCRSGLFFDGIKEFACVEGIRHCVKHLRDEQGTMYCGECINNYGPSDDHKKCLKANKIDYCLTYSSPNTCGVCEDGFIFVDNLCMISPSKNIIAAESCPTGFIPIKHYETCTPIGSDNCIKRKNRFCVECKESYYLNAKGQCQPGSIPNCKRYTVVNDKQVCTECRKGYIIDNDLCRIALTYFNQNCEDIKGEDCILCKDNFLRIQMIKKAQRVFRIAQDMNKLGDKASEDGEKLRQKKIADDQYYLHDYLTHFFINRHIHVNPRKEAKKVFIDKNFNNSDTHLTVCTKDLFFTTHNTSNNCLSYDDQSNKCTLCKDQFGINKSGACEECTIFDLSGRHCLGKDQAPQCLQMDENGDCYVCPKGSIFEVLPSKTRHVIEWKNKESMEYVGSGQKTKKCNIERKKECNTNYCSEAVKVDQNGYCCKRCIAGKTGIYKLLNDHLIVDDCTQNLLFCDLDTVLKGISYDIDHKTSCYACKEDRILVINNSEGKLTSSCDKPKSSKLKGCLIQENEECRHCRPMFTKNEAGVCEPIENCIWSDTVDACNECKSGFVINERGDSCIPNTIENCLIGVGSEKCLKCRNSFFLDNNICFNIKKNNCLRYKSGDCQQCRNNEIKVTISRSVNFFNGANLQSFCVPAEGNNIIKNCLSYENLKNCQKCEKGFLIKINDQKHKVCVPSFGIENCQIVDANSNCIKCEDGYFVENAICIKGNIKNCLGYRDNQNCLICQKDYFVHRGKCFPEPKIQDCKEIHLDKGLTCKKCIETYSKHRYVFENHVCLRLNNIENCKKQENDKCVKCNRRFYIDNGLCSPRSKINIVNCKKLKENADGCEYCEHGYYINKEGDCKLLDEGIFGCDEYKDINTCTLCQKEFYLQNGICRFIGNYIEGCVKYTATGCEKCDQTGYIHKENICMPVKQIKGCNLYSAVDKCKECDKDHYVSDGNCVKVEEPIENCEIYDDLATCKKCIYPYKTKDGKCSYFYELLKQQGKTLQCLVCEPGYFIGQQKICVKSKERTGCLLWSENKRACLLCASGFYQNLKGECRTDSGDIIIDKKNYEKGAGLNSIVIYVILMMIIK